MLTRIWPSHTPTLSNRVNVHSGYFGLYFKYFSALNLSIFVKPLSINLAPVERGNAACTYLPDILVLKIHM